MRLNMEYAVPFLVKEVMQVEDVVTLPVRSIYADYGRRSQSAPMTASLCLGLLSHDESGQRLDGAFPLDPDPHQDLCSLSGGTQDGNRGQGLVVELGDQVGLSGPVFLPNLADLDAWGAHFRALSG